MHWKKKILYYSIFFTILIIAIYFIEGHYRQKRIQEIIYMVQDAQVGLNYRFNVPAISYNESTTGPLVSTLPTIDRINKCFYESSLEDLVASCWNFAIQIQSRYKEENESLDDNTKEDERNSYTKEIKTDANTLIKLNFFRNGLPGEYAEMTKTGFNSLIITFFDIKQPNRVYFAPTDGGLGMEIKFYDNQQIHYFYSFALNGLLGPAVIWNKDGSLQEERFFERPFPAHLKFK